LDGGAEWNRATAEYNDGDNGYPEQDPTLVHQQAPVMTLLWEENKTAILIDHARDT